MGGKLLQGIQILGRNSSIPASAEHSIGMINLNNVRTGTLTCRVTYGAGATTGATVNLYYSADGERFDTVAFTSFLVNLSAGSTVQESAIIDFPENGYVEVRVSNGDAIATNITLWYSLARYGDTYVEGDKVVKLLDDINRRLEEIQKAIPINYNMQA